MAQPGTSFPAMNRKIAFLAIDLSRMKILLQVFYHAFTRNAVDSKKGVVVADTVEALTDVFF